MNKLITLVSLTIFIACNEKEASIGQIAQENDLCICTKEYMPVCGSDGKTYGNTCEAECAKITDYKEGMCE